MRNSCKQQTSPCEESQKFVSKKKLTYCFLLFSFQLIVTKRIFINNIAQNENSTNDKLCSKSLQLPPRKCWPQNHSLFTKLADIVNFIIIDTVVKWFENFKCLKVKKKSKRSKSGQVGTVVIDSLIRAHSRQTSEWIFHCLLEKRLNSLFTWFPNRNRKPVDRLQYTFCELKWPFFSPSNQI